MEKKKVLFAGESWFYMTTETKGFDQFTIGGYQTEIGILRKSRIFLRILSWKSFRGQWENYSSMMLLL